MNPSFLNLFKKTCAREMGLPIISVESVALPLKPHLSGSMTEHIGTQPAESVGTNTVITDNSIRPSLR
jgi:hypothetical protein